MSQLCLIHANCQGDPLALLLLSHPEFAEHYTVRKYTNYLKEKIPAEDFSACRLFLYQHLGEHWNDHASDVLLSRLPAQATALKIPNMLFLGYWPFWTNKCWMPYGDFFLEHLVEQGLSAAEVLHIYLHGDLPKKFDLAAMFESSLQREAEKEQGAVTGTTELVRARWKQEQLFTTINHPNVQLLGRVANAVLDTLGISALAPHVLENFSLPYDEFELPIHPTLGRLHGLPFADADRAYQIYGRSMSFAQYAACYVHCRMHHIENVVGYLHSVRFTEE